MLIAFQASHRRLVTLARSRNQQSVSLARHMPSPRRCTGTSDFQRWYQQAPPVQNEEQVRKRERELVRNPTISLEHAFVSGGIGKPHTVEFKECQERAHSEFCDRWHQVARTRVRIRHQVPTDAFGHLHECQSESVRVQSTSHQKTPNRRDRSANALLQALRSVIRSSCSSPPQDF
jgi:hypothetical protein